MDVKQEFICILKAYQEQMTDGREYNEEDVYQMCEGLIDDLQRLQTYIETE